MTSFFLCGYFMVISHCCTWFLLPWWQYCQLPLIVPLQWLKHRNCNHDFLPFIFHVLPLHVISVHIHILSHCDAFVQATLCEHTSHWPSYESVKLLIWTEMYVICQRGIYIITGALDSWGLKTESTPEKENLISRCFLLWYNHNAAGGVFTRGVIHISLSFYLVAICYRSNQLNFSIKHIPCIVRIIGTPGMHRWPITCAGCCIKSCVLCVVWLSILGFVREENGSESMTGMINLSLNVVQLECMPK